MKTTKQKLFEEFSLKKGLKNTKQRSEILNLFLASDQHLSVEELYLRLLAKNSKIGYVTVYRTLKLFVEAGIANEISFADGYTRYEHVLETEHHDHLVCTNCGAVTEFKNAAIEKLQNEVASKHKFIIKSHKLELYGLCEKCKSKN